MRPLFQILLVFCLCWPASSSFADPAAKLVPPTILVFGDSLSAGYGIEQSRGWVNLLAERLKSINYSYRILNASISGETSHGGLVRLNHALKQKPQIVILELGANDGLRGLPLETLRDNLDAMIKRSLESGARVLLVGMMLPPNYGTEYASGFHAIYLDLAKKYRTQLVPFLLNDIATRRELMQSDNLHPTEEAQPLMMKNVLVHLLPLLKK